jgi:hypothetical protein
LISHVTDVEEKIVNTVRTVSRPLVLLSVIALLVLGLAACGGSSSKSGADPDTAGTDTDCVIGSSNIGECKI